ncbi:MAG: hypothetical protein AABY18_02380 [Candidatus Thermoplasmatota archaeon]
MNDNNKLRIAVDFDGVLFDHVPYVLRGFRDRLGIDLAAEGFRHWDYYQYQQVKDADLPPSQIQRVLRDIETDLKLHREAPRDKLAGRVIAEWIAAGHTVDIVTARSRDAEKATRAFLNEHSIPHHGLVMERWLKTGWDVLIDDAPHNALLAAADGTLALLMDHPYNRDVPTHTNPVRVRDWQEVAERVEAHLDKLAVHAQAQHSG